MSKPKRVQSVYVLLRQLLLCRNDVPSSSVSLHQTSDLYASPGLSERERRNPKSEDMLFKEDNLQPVSVDEYEAAQAAAEGMAFWLGIRKGFRVYRAYGVYRG